MSLPEVPNPEVDRPQAPLRVLVVDDHPAVRDGLTRLLACAPVALRCVGAVGGSAEALEALVALRPDVVILDADLAGQDGLALIPRMAPVAGVLVLTSHGDPGTRARAGQLGALD